MEGGGSILAESGVPARPESIRDKNARRFSARRARKNPRLDESGILVWRMIVTAPSRASPRDRNRYLTSTTFVVATVRLKIALRARAKYTPEGSASAR